jgi:hypothetical protein
MAPYLNRVIKSSAFIESREFIYQLGNCQHYKKAFLQLVLMSTLSDARRI